MQELKTIPTYHLTVCMGQVSGHFAQALYAEIRVLAEAVGSPEIQTHWLLVSLIFCSISTHLGVTINS